MTNIRGKPRTAPKTHVPLDLKPGDTVKTGDGIIWKVATVPYEYWSANGVVRLTIQLAHQDEGVRNFFVDNGQHAFSYYGPIESWISV
jgi:hypothetical protein